MMQERPRGNEYRTTVVCIDSYDGGVPAGRFYNPSCKEGKTFRSLSQLLIKMEDMLDDMKFPQSFTMARTFSSTAAGSGSGAPGSDQGQSGELATFAVRVLFRQNASWQGEVSWLEGKREESFRSVLELILLMDGAMQESLEGK